MTLHRQMPDPWRGHTPQPTGMRGMFISLLGEMWPVMLGTILLNAVLFLGALYAIKVIFFT